MKTCISSMRGRAPVRLCASVVAVLAALPGLAQVQTATLQEVVVTASRSEQLLIDALPHTTVIARDVIERSQAVDLPTLLSSEAGFQFTQSGGRGTLSTLFLRGSASLGVLVLIDGVPMTRQDYTGSVSLEHIMLDQVERVEIVRGNVSAIYGSGAIGGVIQVFTRQGSGKPVGFVQVEAGSYGTKHAAAGISGQTGGTRFTVGVGAHRTSGFSSMDATQYPNENPDADGYRNTNYSLALSHELVKGHLLGLRAQGSEGEFDFDGGGWGSVTDFFKGRNSINTWSVYSHNQFKDNWLSELTLSQGHEKSIYIYDATLPAYHYDSEAVTRSRTVNWTNKVNMGNDWLATLGAEGQQQVIDTNDSDASRLNRQRNVTALFAGLSGTVGAHSAQVNVRQDNADGLDAQTTGYLGYGFNVTPAWKVIASTSTAFNLPPLGYLYDPYMGKPELKPETARSHELGLQWAEGSQVVRATLFSTNVLDLMLYDLGTGKFVNINEVSNKGLEVSYSGRLAGADLRASLTQQDPVNESTGGQMIRRAKTMASFGASLPWGAWTLGGDVRYTGQRPDVVANPALAAYTLANLTVRYTLTPELALTGRIDNLFDSQYQTAYGYNQSARAGYVGIVWKQR
jgi:vitamin B12 transporter